MKKTKLIAVLTAIIALAGLAGFIVGCKHTDSDSHGAMHAQTYTCSMHPEVVQNSPGKCPKCGMALEAKN